MTSRIFFRSFCYLLCFVAFLSPVTVTAGTQTKHEKLSTFFGMQSDIIQVECPQSSFDVNTTKTPHELSICLNKAAQEVRCEITVKPFHKAPYSGALSFEMKLSHNTPHPERWLSLFQIHSFPDPSEHWRCPPLVLEAYQDTMRMHNRWDKQGISRTHGYHCAEQGSTIQNRTLFENYTYNQNEWIPVTIDTKLSHRDDGYIKTTIGSQDHALISGPTYYNDQKPPYLKFGLYKPSGWAQEHFLSCITYRNVDISVEK